MEKYQKVQIDDDISVTFDGRIFYKNKERSVIKPISNTTGKKCTAFVRLNDKMPYIQASRLIAKGFLYGYNDDDCIIYKDNDIHNISAGNLKLASKKTYTKFMQRNSGHRASTMEERKIKLDLIIEEAKLTRNFFDTRSFEEINKHVERYLIPCLKDYCYNTIHIGMITAKRKIPEVLAILYEMIDNDACIYNYERYLKKLLYNWKKRGTFGVESTIPNPIHKEINNLNYDCLCQKFNVKKQK